MFWSSWKGLEANIAKSSASDNGFERTLMNHTYHTFASSKPEFPKENVIICGLTKVAAKSSLKNCVGVVSFWGFFSAPFRSSPHSQLSPAVLSSSPFHRSSHLVSAFPPASFHLPLLSHLYMYIERREAGLLKNVCCSRGACPTHMFGLPHLRKPCLDLRTGRYTYAYVI